MVLRGFEVVGAAVVAAEDHERALIEAEFLEQREHFTELAVEHRDHRGIAPRLLGHGWSLVDAPTPDRCRGGRRSRAAA
jgi:hypothetical protein